MAAQHLPRYLGGLAVDKRRTRSNERRPEPSLQGGKLLLARIPVSLTNALATTASGGQGCIYNALTEDNCESSEGTIAAPRVHSESATHRHTGPKTQSHQLRFVSPTLVIVQASKYDSLLTTDWASGNNGSHSILTHRKLFLKHT